MVGRSLAPIDIKLEGIGHVLRDRRLTVPPYQRGYSWEEEEVADFWWDLRAAFGSGESQYFLGTIVLTSDEDGRTTIIDGQQRLATTALLYAAVRNEFSRRGDVHRGRVIESDYIASSDLRTATLVPRVTLNPDDRAAFAEAISGEPGASGDSNLRDHKLLAALRFFEQRVAEEAKNAGGHWAEVLFDWTEFLENRARVIAVEVSDEADAFLIFETLNARGRELTVADLLKNYLFGLARDELDRLQAFWMSALGSLEASAGEEVFTTFVRHFWSSKYGATRERELYNRMRKRITSRDAALEFGEELHQAAPFYAALLSADHPYWDDHPQLVASMETLLRLGLEQNRPLLLAALRRFQPDEFGHLLHAVIAWSVRGLVVGGIGGGTTERAFAEAAIAVNEGTATSTQDIFGLLQNVVPTDGSFRSVFAIRRINRTRIAKYLLIALARHEAGESPAAVVSEMEDSEYALRAVLPRNADPSDWNAYPREELGQWALRLGNQFVERGESGRAPAAEHLVESWTPETVTARQELMAEAVDQIWPRQPRP